MAELCPAEPFVEYTALLDVQLSLYAGLSTAPQAALAALHIEIHDVAQDVVALAAHPGLAESALRCGTAWANEAKILQGGALALGDTEARKTCVIRLRQAAAYITAQTAERPELSGDVLQGIRAVLGTLAVDNAATAEPPSRPAAEQLRPVDYDAALKFLRESLDMLPEGASYALRPAQITTLADPTMSWSRWQRHRFLRLAAQTLPAEGYTFVYNGGRGRSSRYTVGKNARCDKNSILSYHNGGNAIGE